MKYTIIDWTYHEDDIILNYDCDTSFTQKNTIIDENEHNHRKKKKSPIKKYFNSFFKIQGSFNLEDIIKELDIQPSKIITKDGCHELHFNYINKSGIISWENASDILLEVIRPFLGKEKILAELKSKYNLIYDIPIDSDAVDIESVIVLDGKVTNFLYDSKIKENLKWYFF